MADEEEILLQGKTITLLRVVDLKKECDKRGLSKAGSKSQLVERLKAQLLLEKLQQQPINESDEAPNSKLKEDEVTGNNAFIKQYLEKQQKILVVEREARKRYSEEESESSQDERPAESPKKMSTREPSIPEESVNPEPVSRKRQNSASLPISPPQKAPPPPPPTPPPPHAQMADGVTEIGKRPRRRSSLNEEEIVEPKEAVEEKVSRKSRRWRREPEVKEPEPDKVTVDSGMQSTHEVKEAFEEKATSEVEKSHEKIEKPKEEVKMEAEVSSKSNSDVGNSESVQNEQHEETIKSEQQENNGSLTAPVEIKVDQSEGNAEKVVTDENKKPCQEKEKPRSRSSSSSSSSSSRSRSRSEGKPKRSRSHSRSSSSSSSRSRSRSSSSKSDTSISPFKQKGRSPSPPEKKQVVRAPSASKAKEKSRSPSPPRKLRQISHSPRRSHDSSSTSPQRSRQKTESAASSRSSSSSSSSDDKSRSRSKSPNERDRSPPSSPPSSSPAKATQGSKKDEAEQMDIDTPDMKKEENSEDQADTLIVTEDTSEKALDHKEETSEQSASQDVIPKKISLTGRESREKEEDKGEDAEKENKKEKPVRKRKWGSSRSSTDTKPVKRISNINISTDSLKGLIPDIKMTEPVLDLGNDDEKISDQEEDQRDVVKIRRTVLMKDQEEETEVKKEEDEEEEKAGSNVKMEEDQKEEESGSSCEEEMAVEQNTAPTDVTPVKEPKIIRRISQPVPLQETDEPIAPPRSPSPPRNPVSKVVHVGNLVRPFTIKQLKDLLSRTGNIDDTTFWIDKIKSHCFVTYETEEQAVKTRKALHNTKWPSSNPKILWLDFASPEEIEFHKQKEQGPKAAIRKDSQQEMREKREKEKEKREKGAPKKREEVAKPPPIREWDRDKIRQSRERELGPSGKRSGRSRSPSPGRSRRGRERSRDRERTDRKAVPEKKVEDEPPAKLLDDLFKKTKTTPCIYWLPLTDAQVEQREKERLERLAVREKIRAKESPGDNRPANRDRSSRSDRPDFDRRRPPSPYRRPSPPRRGGNEQDSFRDRSGPRRPERGGPPRGGPRSRSKSPRRRR